MALLRIQIKGKVSIAFGSANLSFMRDIDTTQETTISYNSATGQSIAAGQVLSSSGIVGQTGYIVITSKSAVTLNGAGLLTVIVKHKPSSIEGNKTYEFVYDESPVKINLVYNSNPITADVIVETNNRIPYNFNVADFSGKYSDYDNDAFAQVAVFGDVSGFTYLGNPYTSGTYINAANIVSLQYTPLNQNDPYFKDNTWKAKDIYGNESI